MQLSFVDAWDLSKSQLEAFCERYGEAIAARMALEGATDLSDDEIARTVGRCCVGGGMEDGAKALRDAGLLLPIFERESAHRKRERQLEDEAEDPCLRLHSVVSA